MDVPRVYDEPRRADWRRRPETFEVSTSLAAGGRMIMSGDFVAPFCARPLSRIASLSGRMEFIESHRLTAKVRADAPPAALAQIDKPPGMMAWQDTAVLDETRGRRAVF